MIAAADDLLDAADHAAFPAVVGAKFQPGGPIADPLPSFAVSADGELCVDLAVSTFSIDPDHAEVESFVKIDSRAVYLCFRTVSGVALQHQLWF